MNLKQHLKASITAMLVALSVMSLPICGYAEDYSATIDGVNYSTLQDAFNAVAEGQIIELAAKTITETTVTLPTSIKNVTLKGAADHSSIIKDTRLITNNSVYNIDGFTVDGVAFDNSRVHFVSWNGSTIKNLKFTDNSFKNLYDETNEAAIHFNIDISKSPVNGLTLLNNSFDGITGGSKSGVYASVTGEVIAKDNTVNNVAFRPFLFMVNSNDAIEDKVEVTGNTFSGSSIGRMQVSGTNDGNGTDKGSIVISNNIFKDITNAQQICVWDINEEKVTVDFSGNYFDQGSSSRIYWNNSGNVFLNSKNAINLPHGDAENFYYYNRLTTSGTIDTTSKFIPSASFYSENGVWHITAPTGWVKFVESVNDGTDYKGVTVVLDNDLDMTGMIVSPVGRYSDGKEDRRTFSGTFDGQDHTISDIAVQNTPGKKGVGLFGEIGNATIKNLNVTNATVDGFGADNTKSIAYVGGIVGHGTGTIDKCSFSGTINAGHQIGGIGGSGVFSITNCTFDGVINSSRFWAFGGIIGNSQGTDTKITGNTAKGSINIVCDNVLESYKNTFAIGGIVGSPYSNKQVIQDNYSAIKLIFNGVEKLNPVVGMYNDGDNKTMGDDFSSLANNTWDKSIYNIDSFEILREVAGKTDWVSNYDGATVKAEKTLESNTLVLRNLNPIDKDGTTLYRMAFFAAVDSVDYDKVGFKLTVDGVSKEISTQKVFTSVTYKSSNTNEKKTVTATDFDLDGKETKNKYIFGLTEGFSGEYISKPFSVVPFAVDADGKYIWGTEVKGEYIYNK